MRARRGVLASARGSRVFALGSLCESLGHLLLQNVDLLSVTRDGRLSGPPQAFLMRFFAAAALSRVVLVSAAAPGFVFERSYA